MSTDFDSGLQVSHEGGDFGERPSSADEESVHPKDRLKLEAIDIPSDGAWFPGQKDWFFESEVKTSWQDKEWTQGVIDLPSNKPSSPSKLAPLNVAVDVNDRDRSSKPEPTRDSRVRQSIHTLPYRATKPRESTHILEPPTPYPVGKEQSKPGGDPMADIWPIYLEHTLAEDRETVQTWNTDLDSILIFAALFSAVLTTFIVESYQGLQADPTTVLLQAILLELQATRNASAISQSGSAAFQVSRSAIRVNVYWFSSLILSLATALIAILAKQWVNYLLAGLSPVPATRARHRQYRIDGINKWRLPGLLSFLPILLHIALLLFFAGLVDFVWDLNPSVAGVSAFLVCTTSIVYVIANILAYVYPECPFKTSVTVFFAVVVDLLVYSYGEARLAIDELGHMIRVTITRAAQTWRSCLSRERLSSPVEDGLPRLPRTSTLVETKPRRKYEPLRISSLRSQDEKYIAEHQSSVDARILIWLTQNSDRLYEVEQLSDAIVGFPDLPLHRQLFIQHGSFAFLERSLVTRWSPTARTFSQLSSERQLAVTSVLHALAVLESEAGADSSVAYTTALDPDDTLVSKKRSPFLLIESTVNPTGSLLSPSSFPIIASLLDDSKNLPLSLASSVLRLSVRVPRTEPTLLPERRARALAHVNAFLLRVAQPQSQLVSGEQSDISHAVNTVIYLALYDVSYPDRDGLTIPVVGDTSYWLDILSTLIVSASMTATARRQLSWAICALALTPPAEITTNADSRIIVKPRIPRFQRVEPFVEYLTELISCETDPDVLCAALAAVEGTLWNASPDEAPDIADLCRCLLWTVPSFLAQLSRRLQSRQMSPTLVAKVTLSTTRVAVYLAMFHDSTPSTLRTNLILLTLGLLGDLANEDPSSLSTTVYALREHPSRMNVVKLDKTRFLWWIYRVGCRIISLWLEPKPPKTATGQPDVDPLELIFANNTQDDVASAFVAIVKAFGERTSMQQLDPSIQQTLFTILKVAFQRGTQMQDTENPPPINGSHCCDWQAIEILAAFISKGGLIALLLVPPEYTTLRDDVLGPALKSLSVALYEPQPRAIGEGPSVSKQRRSRSRHTNLKSLFDRVRNACEEFFDNLGKRLHGSELPPNTTWPEEQLVHVIRIYGYMASRTSEYDVTPDPDATIAMLQFITPFIDGQFSELVTNRAVRRHAWGAIGSLVTLYCADVIPEGHELEDLFRLEAFDADVIAIGLVRSLILANFENEDGLMPHCQRCCLEERERLRLRQLLISPYEEEVWLALGGVVTTALKAIVYLWRTRDPEAIQVKEALLRHDFLYHLQPCLSLQGEPGDLARGIQDQLVPVSQDRWAVTVFHTSGSNAE